MKILLVEDDVLLAKLITRHLSAQHYVVDVVTDGAAGWSYGSTFDYDLLIFDLMLPQLNGIHLCQRLRAEGDMTPILLLTAKEGSASKIQALDAGADDYMVKPFDMGELEARIRALLRRGQGQASPLRIWGDLLLNPMTCEVSYGDRPLKLTSKEYKLLELLIANGVHVVSVEEVLERLWSSEEFPVESTVRSHVRRLRKKLQRAGAPVDFISTLHGRGYYLKPSEGEGAMLSSELPSEPALLRSVPSSVEPPSEVLTRTAIEMQYLQFLNETWPTAQKACVQEIQRMLQEDPGLRPGIAHRLAGTLGMFGLSRIVEAVRQLESDLQPNQALPPEDDIQAQLQQLRRWVQQTTTIAVLPEFSEQSVPVLWILSSDAALNQELSTAAMSQRLESRSFESWQGLCEHLESEPPPNQMIARLEHLRPLLNRPKELAKFQAGMTGIPLLILGECDTLGDRLQALRLGGTFLLQANVSAEQMITASLIAVHKQSSHALQPRLKAGSEHLKVMLVDDDPHVLKHLLQQLNPFGFKVTTLAEPKHFWNVLQSVKPDALVLDIKIPEIDGLELCQLVRHDPRWKRLPILFLSILNDPETRQQAFSVGADDYLFKPIRGHELAHRILSRLERIDALAH